MRMLSRIVVVVLCLTAALTAQTQNLVGQWQGTLAFQGKELRLVFVLAASGQGNTLSATLYSIDQAPNPIPATITVQGGAVRIAVAVAGITFDGKLSPDNNSIVGTFTQGPGSTPLTLARATGDTAFPIPAPPKTLAADAPMTFEVATIKPSDPARPSGPGITMRPPDVVTFNTSLGYLMGFAYDMQCAANRSVGHRGSVGEVRHRRPPSGCRRAEHDPVPHVAPKSHRGPLQAENPSREAGIFRPTHCSSAATDRR